MDIFDEKLALEKVGGNRELMLELYGMMIGDLPKSIAELGSALHNGDKAAWWNIAHRLAGSTAYSGVPALQASSKALENSIKNNLDDITARFVKVQQDVQDVIHYHRKNLC